MTTTDKTRPPAVTFLYGRDAQHPVAAIRLEPEWADHPKERPDILSARLLLRWGDRFIVTETTRLEPEHGETYYVQIHLRGVREVECYFTDDEMKAFRRWMAGATVGYPHMMVQP